MHNISSGTFFNNYVNILNNVNINLKIDLFVAIYS